MTVLTIYKNSQHFQYQDYFTKIDSLSHTKYDWVKKQTSQKGKQKQFANLDDPFLSDDEDKLDNGQ